MMPTPTDTLSISGLGNCGSKYINVAKHCNIRYLKEAGLAKSFETVEPRTESKQEAMTSPMCAGTPSELTPKSVMPV